MLYSTSQDARWSEKRISALNFAIEQPEISNFKFRTELSEIHHNQMDIKQQATWTTKTNISYHSKFENAFKFAKLSVIMRAQEQLDNRPPAWGCPSPAQVLRAPSRCFQVGGSEGPCPGHVHNYGSPRRARRPRQC